MKCPKCKNHMEVDIENRKYICKFCKYEIKWLNKQTEDKKNVLYGF
jgi:DNA-directed RNA polymerase subunit M/transcription elongation factor TFIIS